MTNVATKIPAHYRPAVSLVANDLLASSKEVLSKIQKFISENDLRADQKYSANSMILTLEEYIFSESKTGKKKLAKFIRNLNRHISIRRINRFQNFIRNKMGKTSGETYLMILPSKQEQEVIEARNKFKDLKLKLELARTDYHTKKKEYKGKYLAS